MKSPAWVSYFSLLYRSISGMSWVQGFTRTRTRTGGISYGEKGSLKITERAERTGCRLGLQQTFPQQYPTDHREVTRNHFL